MNNKSQLTIGIFSGILITSLIFGAYLLGTKNTNEDAPIDKNTKQVSPTNTVNLASPTSSPSPILETGIITGSISFPSEFIPEDLEVCASNTITNENTCTTEHIKSDVFQYGVGYKIEVLPGSYVVYAKTPDSDYKAYFSEAVLCGLTVECSDHTPVVIKVKANESVNAHPQDWYNIQP